MQNLKRIRMVPFLFQGGLPQYWGVGGVGGPLRLGLQPRILA